jgi:putative glutamine amidotransferase
MSSPVIGITGRRSRTVGEFPENLNHLTSDLFVVKYSEAVAAAGGLPVLIPREAEPSALVPRLDAILIAGGQDIDPRRYGGVPGPRSTVLDPERDAFEIALVRTAVQTGTPVLGICRGAQLINVALGGTLVVDLPAGTGESHSFLGYPAGHRSHPVITIPGTTVAALYGPRAQVNSYHHQAVAATGSGLVASAVAPDDVIEAIELPGADVIGVQWHPEMLEGSEPVFDWLVQRAATHLTTNREETVHAVA